MDIVKKHGPQLGYYQFDEPTFSVSSNVQNLAVSDPAPYEAFMSQCDPIDRNMVCMDFLNPFHTFFAYVENGKILSLGNYMRDNDADRLAHMGIVTLPEAKGK
jgi:hypothetical protein